MIRSDDDRLTVRQGDLSIQVSLGNASVTAMQSIELRVGSSLIRIDQTGITISGTMIQINGSAMTDIQAPMVSVSGDASTVINGGMVEIN